MTPYKDNFRYNQHNKSLALIVQGGSPIGGTSNYSMTDASQISVDLPLEGCLEGLLFVAAGPVTLAQLAETVGKETKQVEEALKKLDEQYAAGRGLSLQWHAGRVQLTTAPGLASLVERFLGLEATSRLTRPALETLTIIAYRQPVTRPAIDAVRGVNSDGVLKSLLSKGLVQEVGRMEGPGRPILYGTTVEFLQYFGLKSLVDLPSYETSAPEEEEQTRLLKD